jgi:dihydrofolate synthase / folylpolyglutamate synthase
LDFQQALEFLETLPDMERARHGSGVTMTLETMKVLLGLLGHPERKARTIHITGSKGKGSTATFITSILEAAGFRTALFTSPHLHSYRERIAFGLEPVSEEDFARGVNEIARTIHKSVPDEIGPVSTFGILTALFFHLVATRAPAVDWQIVEVGLGGTHDATNVFTKKEIAVITPISLDHTAILGDSTASIAEHKAGIITHGASVILAPQHDRIVKQAVSRKCKEISARLIDVDELFKVERLSFDLNEQTFRVSGPPRATEYGIKFGGRHQIANACTALATIEVLKELGHRIDEAAVRDGLGKALLPGRFELMKLHEYGTSCVLDGAHNGASASALTQSLKEYFPGKEIVFLLALNRDKDVHEFWTALAGCSRKVIVTKTHNPRALTPEVLKECIMQCDPYAEIVCAPSLTDALAATLPFLERESVICVTGSLYLVAEAREFLTTLGARISAR